MERQAVEIERKIRFRIGVFLVLIAVLVGLYTARLFKLQEPAAASEAQDAQSYTYRSTVQAARGEILDRNGTVLVSNRASYNIQIDRYVLLNADQPNQHLLELAELCASLGVAYVDHLPISLETPYTYTLESQSSTWQNRFRLFMDANGWDTDMSPQNLMRELRDAFNIPEEWTEEQARRVVGLRYELALRAVDGTGLESYILISDVDTDTLASIMELSTPGLSVQTTTVRVYNTEYAAHILGYLGSMMADEYEETYQALGYPMNAQVGRTGVELAFEEVLHGVDGEKVTTVSEDGEILDEYWVTEPEAGDNVMLTIDIEMQAAAEEALEEIILDLRANGIPSSSDSQGRGTDAEGGALVAIEVDTGKVLVSASYPTFSLETFYEDYAEVSQDPYNPYYNRALSPGAPGSTFKMVTAIAAIDSAGIGRYREIEDQGRYTYFETYQPECLIYTNTGTTHGIINMMEALEVSCNYYFYEVGRETGITAIDTVARNLGLGEPTGIELPEEIGHRANAETKAELYANDPNLSGWYDADTVAAAIGQSENSFTPLQLANYTAALANGGPRYKVTILERVVSSDYEGILVQNEPQLVSSYTFSEEAMACVEEGMRLAASGSRGTATAYLGDYEIAVCAKTGTAEHGAGGSANGVFVCYAPADDPQIAIAVYVEKGGQGGNLARAARAVMDVYFQTESSEQLTGENTVN